LLTGAGSESWAQPVSGRTLQAASLRATPQPAISPARSVLFPGQFAAVASVVAGGLSAVRHRWPQRFHRTRQRRHVLSGNGKATDEVSTEVASESVIDRLYKNQRDNIQVLVAGITAALAFGLFVTGTQGFVAGAEWFSCYIIEYSLSVDNLFVFIVIFDYFKVTGELQSKVLNYGIAGAVILRFLFVFLGAELLQRFDFLILVFAAILVYASFQGFASSDDDEEEEGIEDSLVYRTLKGVMEISPQMDGENFFTEVSGKMLATPLFLCLLVIEFSDIVFATDSVPAVLGTTQDPFIAYTSNIFAVFGLRSLFFLLREAMTKFEYLEPAVSTVLGFIGVKIILDYFKILEVPILVSLAIVVTILAAGIGLSLQELNAKEEKEEDAATQTRL